MDLSPSPQGPHQHAGGQQTAGRERPCSPTTTAFSGVVFKVQANMDANHRDRIAFVRVASGKYTPA